jgi:signal transduction histidine kinase
MSHELRTPMNAILGYSQMLQLMAHDRLNEKDKEYIDHIMQSGQHLLALITDVLDLAKVETGTQEIEKENLEVSDILSQAEHIIRPIAANKNIAIECPPLPADMPQIRSSRIHLNQILLNLLSNAVKYSPQGSRVTMAARVVAPNRIRLSVTDQGCGIAPKDQAIIFSPFTRLHGNTMTSAEGIGIGLAVSKKLAENLGGTIGVDSEIGAGSTFWVEF